MNGTASDAVPGGYGAISWPFTTNDQYEIRCRVSANSSR